MSPKDINHLDRSSAAPLQRQGLGLWNLYFIIKLALFYKGIIDFHVLENLCLFCLLLFPLPNKAAQIGRNILGILLAVLLLHYDSYLPPLERLTAQFDLLLSFESAYLLELLLRFIPTSSLIPLLLIIAVYYFLSRIFRMTAVVAVAIFAVSIQQYSELKPSSPLATTQTPQTSNDANSVKLTQSQSEQTNLPDAKLNAMLASFFSTEENRQIVLPAELGQSQNFDILLLSICSLSWDDMEIATLSDHPFFQDFDLVFDNFNSATSYSGPALLRLNRAACGQPSHLALYQTAPEHCLLFHQLSQQGYGEALLMNHDGKFDNMLERTRRFGQLDAKLLSQEGLAVRQKAFAGSPIYSDLAVLERWWQQRLQSDDKSVIALYNSATLHDGNKLIDRPALKGLESYSVRAQMLLDDLKKFNNRLKHSGRPIVVILVPEHGGGLRGDKMQVAGMREIPSPAITHVPVAVKLFGKEIQRRDGIAHVKENTSHLALVQLIRNIAKAKIYDGQGTFSAEDLAQNMPKTRHVSQNEGSTVMAAQDRYYISLDDQSWSPYPHTQ